MITGQILVYHFNGLHNAKEGVERNLYTLRDVNVNTGDEFKSSIVDALDEVPPGRGYALIKWEGRIFLAEKDSNDPDLDYVRHEVTWHPLIDKLR